MNVQDGRKVAVKMRGQTVGGLIESVVPVTDALPPEFQLPTKARGRGQLVRVALNSGNDFAVGQKAVVTNCYFRNCQFSLSGMRNPVQRGHRFQRKADSNPVIADSR